MRQYVSGVTARYSPGFYSFVALRYRSTEIMRSNDFSSIISAFSTSSKKSVAFFDLDNTLIMSLGYKPPFPFLRISGYGNDRWFSHQEKKIKQSAAFRPEHFMLLLAEFHAIQPYLQQITTEDCVSEKLVELKRRGIPIFGLTARSPCVAELSNTVLKKQGIEFTQDQSSVKESEFLHQYGITFCNGRSKKEGLNSFLKTPLGRHALFGVERVLFMDDKESHVKEVKEFLDENNFEAVAVHYTHVETQLPMMTDADIEKNRKALIRDHGLSLPRI